MLHETRAAYGEVLQELAALDKNVVAFDADLSKSTKTAEIKKVDPKRHFNAGIAEANMMGMAAGMAVSGKLVFASSFAVFASGRPYEIIRNSIAYPKLNVKICATHAGVSVGEDGASHQAIADIAIMRALPNVRVYVVSDYYETKALIRHVAKIDGPCYVRMQRGKSEDIYDESSTFDFDKVRVLNKGKDICVFACGLMVQEALRAAAILKKEDIDITVCEVVSIKPLDEKGVTDLIAAHKYNFTFEEHSIIGGLYGAIAEAASKAPTNPLYPLGLNDVFGSSGKAKDVLEKYGLCAEHLVKVIKEKIK